MVRIIACLACIALAAIDAGSASAGNLALVIGNDDYRTIPKLGTPVADARAMQSSLEKLGFTATIGENLTREQTARLLSEFEGRIRKGDTVIFHFSGHGVAIDGRNLLLPVDVAKPETGEKDAVLRSAFDAAQIIDELRATGAAAVIAVLDASHWNPFAAVGVWNVGATRGLVRTTPARGSFIIYSADEGQVALERTSDEDRDPNSVFISSFAEEILTPGATLVELAKGSQQEVAEVAKVFGHDQVPAYDDGIIGDVFLSPSAGEGSIVPASDAVAKTVPVVTLSVSVPRGADGPPAVGEPPVRSTHGDWRIRCDTPPGAQDEQCVLMQFVTAEDRDNVGLTVIVLKTADKQARIMRILAPLGVLLPSGLGLKIDENDVGRAGFVRCMPNGCVAEVTLEDTLLTRLKAGRTATFIISQTPEEGMGIPISLNGFGPGVDALP